MLEPLLLIAFIYFFAMLAFGRSGWRRWRNFRRERIMRKWARQLEHQPVTEALEAFGPPFEIYEGSERRLYEWKSPPATMFPTGTGLLIVYVVADADGVIASLSWQTRGL